MEISDDRKRYSSIRGHKSNQSESYDFLSADQLSEGVKYEDFGFGVKITHNSFNNISLLKQEVLTRKSQQEQREKEILEFYKFEPSKEEIQTEVIEQMGATDYGIAKGNLATQENMTSYEEKEVKSGCCTSCCLI